MNYILGRNPLDQSYVTGYGERPLENPHHRFWAHQANAKFPSRAAGRRVGRPELGPAGSLRAGGRAAGLRARRSASSTTSRPGRRTRSRSTGTRRSRGWRRTSTRRPEPATGAGKAEGEEVAPAPLPNPLLGSAGRGLSGRVRPQPGPLPDAAARKACPHPDPLPRELPLARLALTPALSRKREREVSQAARSRSAAVGS